MRSFEKRSILITGERDLIVSSKALLSMQRRKKIANGGGSSRDLRSAFCA